MSHISKLSLFFVLIAGIVFVVFPELDIKVVHFFWDPSIGFKYYSAIVVRFVFHYISHVAPLIGIILVISIIFSFFKYMKFLKKYRSSFVFLLMSLLIGPGLFTNVLIKDNWGRARPRDIQEFGGSSKFTPVHVISNQSGTSFVAGHPSMGFYTFSFAMLIKNRKKRRFYECLAILTGIFVGIIRLCQGGHFLSDTLFSGVINISIFIILHSIIIEKSFFKRMKKSN